MWIVPFETDLWPGLIRNQLSPIPVQVESEKSPVGKEKNHEVLQSQTELIHFVSPQPVPPHHSLWCHHSMTPHALPGGVGEPTGPGGKAGCAHRQVSRPSSRTCGACTPGCFLVLSQSQKLSRAQGSGESSCFPEASPILFGKYEGGEFNDSDSKPKGHGCIRAKVTGTQS